MDLNNQFRSTPDTGLPREVASYLDKLEAEERAHLEALFQATLAQSRFLDILDLWDQGQLARSFWVLLTTGVNQTEEMEIAKTLLFWKAFFAQETSRVRCVQSSERRELACCSMRFGPLSYPTLTVS